MITVIIYDHGLINACSEQSLICDQSLKIKWDVIYIHDGRWYTAATFYTKHHNNTIHNNLQNPQQFAQFTKITTVNTKLASREGGGAEHIEQMLSCSTESGSAGAHGTEMLSRSS